MLSFITDLLEFACPILIVVGIYVRKSNATKNDLSKKLIIAGVISLVLGLAISLIFDWESFVKAFEAGQEAARSNLD
jgi:L-cystine uptake protein TcyP (sodium:dicarboxylate symporter family)